MIDLQESRRVMARARELMPGGVNSPARAFSSVGGDPPVLVRGKGARVWDADGNEYIDWVASWGPLILGHAAPDVVEAVCAAARDGTSFGAPTVREVRLAELIRRTMPSMEKMRMVSSGTEATMSALRLARAATGRDEVVKLDGCFHGHGDSLLVKAGSGVETLGLPDSPGVPTGLAKHTLTLPFNDLSAAEALFRERGGRIAAVILEPVVGNMGCIPPREGYLQGLRRICDYHGALLIFDEVMTGYRVALGGAQARYGVRPDLTTLGKVVGGGLPVGVYGGRSEIMDEVAPEGPVYQAGTLSGNPLAMAAGIATLERLSREGVYESLELTASELEKGLDDAIESTGTDARIQRVGTMLAVYFRREPVWNAEDARAPEPEKFARFHRAMLEGGVYLPPSRVESWFVGMAHDEEAVSQTVSVARAGFEVVNSAG